MSLTYYCRLNHAPLHISFPIDKQNNPRGHCEFDKIIISGRYFYCDREETSGVT